MWLVYEGSAPRVDVPALRGLVVERGEPVEVPDEIGTGLLEQRTWRPAVAAVHDDAKPYSEWTAAALRERAGALGLPAKGRKDELIAAIEGEETRQAAAQEPDESDDE